MAADLQKFFFKSKFMSKKGFSGVLVIFFHIVCCYLVFTLAADCSELCQHGICSKGYCICDPGWKGNYCEFCTGKIRLHSNSGIIVDGVGNYSLDNQCAWLIDPGQNNSVIRLYLDNFATECSWDHLYIYDGGSVYDPLLAAFSGVIVEDESSRTPVITTSSGQALVHFYSDVAYNLTGFSIRYKTGGCPSSSYDDVCSGHGACLDGVCTCDGGWIGPSCNVLLCPSNCSGNGVCNMENHTCVCKPGFRGDDCKQAEKLGWWEVPFKEKEQNHTKPLFLHELKRSSHQVAVDEDTAWIVGGYSFSPKSFLVAVNLTDFSVEAVKPNSNIEPEPRFGHSVVMFNDSLYMYGGLLNDGSQSSKLWKFDSQKLVWEKLEPKISPPTISKLIDSKTSKNLRTKRSKDPPIELNSSSEKNFNKSSYWRNNFEDFDHLDNGQSCPHLSFGPCTPVAVVGHASVVINNSTMLILFGYSSSYGTLNLVQEYYFSLNEWKIVETQGALTAGAYGMSATWDPDTSLVFCHGGFRPSSNTVIADLLSYDPYKKKWALKTPAPFPRFLHTSFHMPGLILIFGGNTHNDTSHSYGAKCYSSHFLAYDIPCNKWHWIKKIPDLGVPVSRYGHSAVDVKGDMVVFGGFNGDMQSMPLIYHPGSCNGFTTREQCLDSFPGRKCIWNRALQRCENFLHEDKIGAYDYCGLGSLDQKINYTNFCAQLTTCHACLTHSNYGCLWCPHGCLHEKCPNYGKGIVSLESCDKPKKEFCKSIKSCHLCQLYHPTCYWVSNGCSYYANATTVFQNTDQSSSNKTITVDSYKAGDTPLSKASSLGNTVKQTSLWGVCEPLCFQRTTCDNCTQGFCMWCFSEQRCVSNNSYLISFPFGKCKEWATEPNRCFHIEKGHNKCMVHQSCDTCQADVNCGWCDDNSGTGTGVCLPGGDSGPINPKTNDLLTRTCPESRWFFTSCPSCSCNGHSFCRNTSTCVQPCGNNSEGLHCEHCKESFYGNPINGGLCKPCHCNGHGDTCEKISGKCFCHTKGAIGDHCENCDNQNHYYGHPRKGSCFYELQIDYQFTFNLSKQEDMHIRKINFYNMPSKPDVDTDFDIQCSKPATIRISVKEAGTQETFIVFNHTGMSIKRRFSSSDYIFGSGESNTTFHVYVLNFTPPIEIIISFSQHPKLDLIQFFSIFTLCFMFLLLMAFVMWKIKQKYDLYTRRRRLMVEIEAMASRPFYSIYMELQLNDQQEEEEEPGGCASNSSAPDEQGGPMPSAPAKNCTKTNGPSLKVRKGAFKSSKDTTSKLNGGGSLKRSCNGSLNGIHPQMCIHRPEAFVLKNKNNPSPVALEPCQGNKAAVLSLLIQLPTGGMKYTPSGHPGGLAMASALVSLGTPCQSAVEFPTAPKEAIKNKISHKVKTPSQNNLDTCI